MSAPTPAPVPGSPAFRRLQAKGWLAEPLFRTGLHRLLLRGRGVIVAFHRVDDRLRGNPISCPVDEFRRYLDFFTRNFRVVSLGTMLSHVDDAAGPEGLLAITFDDGYLDNFTNAAPELRARGLPACFFVTTGFIGSRTRPWWDVEYGAAAQWMTWDQVRSLRADGFEIGAHTVSHPDLASLGPADTERELREARAELERELAEPVSLLSYPYGGPQRMNDDGRLRAGLAGYRCCLSGFGGTVRRGDDPMRLRRSPITPWHVSPAHFGFELLFRPPLDAPARAS